MARQQVPLPLPLSQNEGFEFRHFSRKISARKEDDNTICPLAGKGGGDYSSVHEKLWIVTECEKQGCGPHSELNMTWSLFTLRHKSALPPVTQRKGQKRQRWRPSLHSSKSKINGPSAAAGAAVEGRESAINCRLVQNWTSGWVD